MHEIVRDYPDKYKEIHGPKKGVLRKPLNEVFPSSVAQKNCFATSDGLGSAGQFNPPQPLETIVVPPLAPLSEEVLIMALWKRLQRKCVALLERLLGKYNSLMGICFKGLVLRCG